MKNIALISPNLNAYSETFIQNHKKNFEGNVKFYYGGHFPTYLEGSGHLWISSKERLAAYIKANVFQIKNIPSPEYKALEKSFKREKINIVYAEYGPTGYAIMDICKKMGLPLIVHFHGYDASMTRVLEEYRDAYKEMFKYASVIIAVSKIMEQDLIKIGCPAEKLKYITYGPEDNFFSVTPSYKTEAFLSIGRFVDKKAPYLTILAFKKVLEKFPKAKLYMAGDGVLLNTCINLSKYLKIEENIIFIGQAKHHELISYYEKVRAFVQHSVTAIDGDMEGTPVAIIEASAAALPVISTKHAGIPDVIIDGETGLLVDEHDVDGMAQNMIYILENELKAKEMGEKGRMNIYENFSMKIHIDNLNSIISEYAK